MSKAHLSSNSIIRASSGKTKRVAAVHESEEHGPGVLWTWSMEKQQAIASCKQEFPDDEEIIGVPECPDCGELSNLRYHWRRQMWECRICGYVTRAETPTVLPQEGGQ